MGQTPSAPRMPAACAHVLVAGPVRNCSATIARETARLAHALSPFASVSFLLAESDSTDDSVATLQRLAHERPGFAFVSLGDLRHDHPIRCDRIAVCRNYYQDIIRTSPAYRHIDYIIEADMDGLNTSLDAQGVLTCWETDIDWGGITANQRLCYYDIWALRHRDWSPVDCWAAYRAIVDVVGPRQALEVCVSSKQIRLPLDAGLIEVDSSFGGFAIYKREAYLSGRFVGLDENGAEVNEHIAFHDDLRAHGHRLYINPAMINAEYTDHTYYKTRIGHLRTELMWNLREAADRLRCRDGLESIVKSLKRVMG
ncbi:Glycosyltransferase [Cupriavidus necator]|uniref:hypothetical protein n=1 Tax=Cupriavidus necator TaxID=106590 RepID=UPI003F734488